MPVDVISEVEIARPRDEVAAYACNPENATAWYANITSVEWLTPKPLAIGSRVVYVAQFLGRRLAYTYEVRDWVPGECFVMSTAEGPFPMETIYGWEDAGGGTRMTLRNRGEPSGFARISAPMMATAIRRANRRDLRRLKQLLEQATGMSPMVAPEYQASRAIPHHDEGTAIRERRDSNRQPSA